MKCHILPALNFLIVMFVAACNEKTPSTAQSGDQKEAASVQTIDTKILGKWMLDGSGTYEFFRDGSAMFTSDSKETMGGRWVSAGEDRVKIDFTGMLGVTVTYLFAEIRFSDNGMSVREEVNNVQLNFTKG